MDCLEKIAEAGGEEEAYSRVYFHLMHNPLAPYAVFALALSYVGLAGPISHPESISITKAEEFLEEARTAHWALNGRT